MKSKGLGKNVVAKRRAMHTKYLLFPIALTCTMMLGCSDDPASADNVVNGTTAIDSLQPEPYIDPLTGEVVSASTIY